MKGKWNDSNSAMAIKLMACAHPTRAELERGTLSLFILPNSSAKDQHGFHRFFGEPKGKRGDFPIGVLACRSNGPSLKRTREGVAGVRQSFVDGGKVIRALQAFHRKPRPLLHKTLARPGFGKAVGLRRPRETKQRIEPSPAICE